MKVQINPAVKIIIVLGESEYPMTKPQLGAVNDFEERLEQATANKKGGVKVMMDFVVACGLPEEVVKSLDVDQLQAIMGAITPAKKN